MPVPVVGSARSLINSIKNGTLNRVKHNETLKSKTDPQATPKTAKAKPAVPSTSKRWEQDDKNESSSDEDGVDLRIEHSSDDEYGVHSTSSSEGEYSSSPSNSDQDDSVDDRGYEPRDSSPEPLREEGPPRDNSGSEDELDRNDPRVKRLLEKLRKEDTERSAKKGNSPAARSDCDNLQQVGTHGKVKLEKNIKSPSDTMLYAPALHKEAAGTPLGVTNRHISRPVSGASVANVVSDFVGETPSGIQEKPGSRS